MLLVACDLDGTLIYSRRAVGVAGGEHQLRCVELIDGAPASFMTEAAASGLANLSQRVTLVPVSTRSPAQFARLHLPMAAPYAVLANGGRIYLNGQLDAAWNAQIAARLRGGTPFDEVWRHARASFAPDWTTSIREVEQLFCYAVLDIGQVPASFLDEERAWAHARGWRTSLQGSKFYWVPRELTKAAAVAEIVRRTGAEGVLAAGDALLDTDLLELADLGVHPSHGELADARWSAPGVTQLPGQGVLAGQQIVEWLAGAVAAMTAATTAQAEPMTPG